MDHVRTFGHVVDAILLTLGIDGAPVEWLSRMTCSLLLSSLPLLSPSLPYTLLIPCLLRCRSMSTMYQTCFLLESVEGYHQGIGEGIPCWQDVLNRSIGET